MKIFLTGASGFLGSNLARILKAQGHELSCLVRKTSKVEHLKKLGCQLVEGNLPDTADISSYLSGMDVVIHCAGAVKAYPNENFFKINQEGTRYLARQLLKTKIKPKKLIHISTIALFNSSQDGIDYCLAADECHPISAYGQSKAAAEEELKILKDQIHYVILRPPVIYGPGDEELTLVYESIRKNLALLYKKGDQKLSLVHVSDVCSAVHTLLSRKTNNASIYCLDDGNTYTQKQLLLTIASLLNKKPFLIPAPHFIFSLAGRLSELLSSITKKAYVFNSEKVKELAHPHWVCGYQKLNDEFGWKPEVKIEDGLKQTFQSLGYLISQ